MRDFHVALQRVGALRLGLDVEHQAAAARQRRVDLADLCREAAVAREAPYAAPPLYAPLCACQEPSDWASVNPGERYVSGV